MVAGPRDLVDRGSIPAVVGVHPHLAESAAVKGLIWTVEGALGVDDDPFPALEGEGALAPKPGDGVAVLAELPRRAVGPDPLHGVLEVHEWHRLRAVGPGPAAVGVDPGA